MTKKLEQLSDRELDALVAEHVMGWIYKDFKTPYVVMGQPETNSKDYVPPFSTDISAAFEVVKKMNKDKDGPQYSFGIDYIQGVWQANFILESKVFFSEYGTVPARAICEASLRAKGVL